MALSISNWRQTVNDIGMAAADNAHNAVTEELKSLNKEVDEDDLRVFHEQVAKLGRQLVRSKFIPNTHLDV